jgi:hypothetical protein
MSRGGRFKTSEPFERDHFLGTIDGGSIDRGVQDVDRPVVGQLVHRKRDAVLAAVGERKPRRVAHRRGRPVKKLGGESQRA